MKLTPPRIRSALFVDFDNIYIGLKKLDTRVARRFADDPGKWLDWLEDRAISTEFFATQYKRRILVRRCYLNSDCAEFSEYHMDFTYAGFEVVDCPPLTQQGKNAADIRMALDIVDVLDDSTIDEVIIMSGDADFTPVLRRIRRADRFGTILTTSHSSGAYKATCDHLIPKDQFISCISGPGRSMATSRSQTGQSSKSLPAQISATTSVPPSSSDRAVLSISLHERVAQSVANLVGQSDEPVTLAVLAQDLRRQYPDGELKNWLGAISFKAMLVGLDLGELEFSTVAPGYVYDPSRHKVPIGRPGDEWATALTNQYPDIASHIQRFRKVTELPRLLPNQYAAVYQELADELNQNGFDLTDTSKAIRNRCVAKEIPIGRAGVSEILYGLINAEYGLGDIIATKESVGQALLCDTIATIEHAQGRLTDQQRRAVETWLMSGLDATET